MRSILGFCPNNRHQKRARWALDSQQVARVCGGRYNLKGVSVGRRVCI